MTHLSTWLSVTLAGLCVPSLAWADDPPVDPASEIAPPADPGVADPGVAVSPSDVAIAPVDVSPAPTTTVVAVETSTEDYYVPPEPYTPEPEPRTTLKLSSGYFGMGILPGLTLHHRGFHPMTRFELEAGGTIEHRHRDLSLSFGVAMNLQPYYGRKTPAAGADVTSTLVIGPVYLRTGLGAIGFVPISHRVNEYRPAIGGVVGLGLTFGREPMIRVGVDYDFRVSTRLEPIHTFMLAFRFACCRKN